MKQRDSLSDRTIARIKNNRVVAILIVAGFLTSQLLAPPVRRAE